jgi:NSS family neurotransmitter:Na+ symporter
VLEVVVAYFSEELNMSRSKATILGATGISIVGVFATLSFGPLSDLQLLERTIFGWFDFLSANVLLPLGAIFIVIFVGWHLGKKKVLDEISSHGQFRVRLINLFMIIVKFIAPLAIAAVFIYGLGIIK